MTAKEWILINREMIAGIMLSALLVLSCVFALALFGNGEFKTGGVVLSGVVMVKVLLG